jgi:cytochrome P450
MTATTAATIPPHVPQELVFDFDFYDMTGEADVFEKYRKLHELPDIFYTPRYGGHWVVQRFDLLAEIFETPEVFSNRQQTIPPAPQGGFGMTQFDGEQHAAYRRLIHPTLVQPFLQPTVEGEKLDAFITQVCISLIEGMVDRGECEFFREFATKLPATVVMKALVDLPIEDMGHLEELTDAVARSGGDTEKFNAAFAGLFAYFTEKIIPQKRANPGNDTISAIVHGQPEGRPLSDQEIVIQCALVMIGGLDTVSAELAFIAQYLAEHPEQRRRLIDDPSLIPEAVEEFLRRFGVVNIARIVARDIDFHGVHLAEGDMVAVPTTAASIDEKHFPDPFTVDFDREDKKHLTFHRGPHSCVGALIARRELRIFLKEWLARIPDFQIKPGAQVTAITGLGNRLTGLPLVWEVPADRSAAVEPGELWLTPEQEEVDKLAVSLLDHADVQAARSKAVARYQTYPEYRLADAPPTLDLAIDDLMFGCLQIAANDEPTRPRVIWTARMPYVIEGQRIHNSCYGGDVADRVYRSIGVRPEYRYEITGRRHPTHPSVDDFSFEAVPAPGLWGQPMARLQAPDGIEVGEDGSFTITVDSTPPDGRRNHLYLPPGTEMLFVRDTLLNWASQLPNELTIRVVDAPPQPARSRDQIAADGVAMFEHCLDMAEAMFVNATRPKPTNTLTPFLRPVQWGVGGGVIALNNFELGDGEALMLTLDTITAEYLSIAVYDPWMTSIPYDIHSSTLNNLQAQPNHDGTYTFVISPTDPGLYNWLDTAGMRTGIILARWERFAQAPVREASDGKEIDPWTPRTTIEEAVREARLVKSSDVAAAIPAGLAPVSPEERKRLTADRLAAYRVRVTGRPLAAPTV